MRLPARAKVNLRLRILGRMADGFHAVKSLYQKSLYQRLEHADTVRIVSAGVRSVRTRTVAG